MFFIFEMDELYQASIYYVMINLKYSDDEFYLFYIIN